jgi:hypothetical protein
VTDVDPWKLINEAGVLDNGPERTARLHAALAELEDLEPAVLEARAVALSLLALDDSSELMHAKEACDAAQGAGATTALPYAHLAEALLNAEEFEDALDACARVDTRKLEELDLHWRVVRIDEIRAACLVRLRRLGEAELPIARVLKELVNEDIEEFLPSPIELLYALVDTAEDLQSGDATKARTIVCRFASQLPVESWFREKLAERINAICEQRP